MPARAEGIEWCETRAQGRQTKRGDRGDKTEVVSESKAESVKVSPAGMALRQWAGRTRGTPRSWGTICLVISLLLQLPGAHSKCYFQAQAPCHYEGKYFTLGESWLRSDCFHCTCLHPVGVGCCDTSQHPIDFPAGCEVRREEGTCHISLVQKSDPHLPCRGGPPDLEWGSANTPDSGAPGPRPS